MRELTSLAEADRKIALGGYRILRPHLEDGKALSIVASEAGVAYSTAQRWVSLYRRFGMSALVHKRRCDRGQRRALSRKLREIVEAIALEKPPLPIAALHRQICKIAQETDQNIPTYKAVYRIVSELPKDLLVLAHEGAKAYAEAFDLIHRREADRPKF
jgi:putative transposase